MKCKVAELDGTQLDAAVAKVEGWTQKGGVFLSPDDSVHAFSRPEFSSQWRYGGPIIERERIEIHPRSDCGLGNHWGALPYTEPDQDWSLMQRGATPLIAAMRAFVASKLGDEIGDV